MKIHPVWSIHIVTFVFSGLVLAVSAFSNFRAITLKWTSGTTYTSVAVNYSRFYLLRSANWPTVIAFDYYTKDAEQIESYAEGVNLVRTSESNFLGITRVSGTFFLLFGGLTPAQIYEVPLASFLLLPMTWICGFYLFKVRRHLRARRAEKQIQTR